MQTVDVKFFRPFIDATQHTLSVQCSLEASPGKPFIRKKGPPAQVDIVAVIGLASARFKGAIGLLFPKTVFLALMSNMLGENYTEITDELEDGAAELLNIIFGHAKRTLNDQNSDIQMAVPSIIRGSGISTTHVTKSTVVVLPFTTEKGDFFIEITIENGLSPSEVENNV